MSNNFWVSISCLLGLGLACLNGPCYPGNEQCGAPFTNAPMFHLMDQAGCGENDPNGPVFDPVHGVFHHFYQIHLAAVPGHGPDYGHFVSKDFVHWAALPVAIWNGLDSSVWPPAVTPYDNMAIFTGSAVVVDGAGPNGSPGVVQIYPGLCRKEDWPSCGTGTLLAQAVPANYASDQLLTNWSKPSYNPIMNNTQRDPSTPWKTSHGEWRLRTYDSKVYGASNDADLLSGRWYEIGTNKDLRTCECPSLYPLPAATPGFEVQYSSLEAANNLPTHVHKTSCGGDWWQIGNYVEGSPKVLGSFKAAPGWDDVFEQRKIDQGNYYASKDSLYPTKSGETRRVNWGWATVPPQSTQSLPREITFNPAARTLQQAPIAELEALRSASVYSANGVSVSANAPLPLGLQSGVARQSELVAQFTLPSYAATFGVVVGDSSGPSGTPVARMMTKTDMTGGDYNITHYPAGTDPAVCQSACDSDARCVAWTYVIRGSPAGSGDCCLKSKLECPRSLDTCTSGAKKAQNMPGCGSETSIECIVEFSPPSDASAPFYEVPVSCGSSKDVLRLLPGEKTVELRIFSDWTFIEAYFQQGRVAITKTAAIPAAGDYSFTTTRPVTVQAAQAFALDGIWVSPDQVRQAPRVYH